MTDAPGVAAVARLRVGVGLGAPETVVPEAADYVAYFCGLDCYAAWRNRAGLYLQ